MKFNEALRITCILLLVKISGILSLGTASDVRFEYEWSGKCADGRSQSPISIPNARDRTKLSHINIEFYNFNVPIPDIKVTNAARLTAFEWDRSLEERSVIIRTSKDVAPFQPGIPYILQNFHVHHGDDEQSGTLHFLEGSSFAMEMHFLFVRKEFDSNVTAAYAAPGNALEIAVLWKLTDTHNRAWAQLNDLMLSKKLAENEKIQSTDLSIRLTDFIPRSSRFSLYNGSVPVNGCPEVNTWVVFDTLMEFDTSDLAMRHWTYLSGGQVIPLKHNIRRIQSLNGRPVYQGRTQGVIFLNRSANVSIGRRYLTRF